MARAPPRVKPGGARGPGGAREGGPARVGQGDEGFWPKNLTSSVEMQ